MFNFWWSAGLVNGLEPHLPPLSSQKMKCLFLDYVQLLVIGRDGRWTRIPSATSLQQKNEMLVFGLHSTSNEWPGWSMDSNPICHISPAKKMKSSFLDYVQLLTIGWAGWWTQTLCSPYSSFEHGLLLLSLLVIALVAVVVVWMHWGMLWECTLRPYRVLHSVTVKYN